MEEGTGRGTGNCDQCVLYERRIKKQKIGTNNLQIQGNPHQRSNDILHRERETAKVPIEVTKTTESHKTSKQKSTEQRITLSDLRFYNRAIKGLAQKQACRPMRHSRRPQRRTHTAVESSFLSKSHHWEFGASTFPLHSILFFCVACMFPHPQYK